MAKKKALIDRDARISQMRNICLDKPDVLQFMDKIQDHWEEFIQFKYDQHSQQYATPTSEFYAIRRLFDISDGSPEMARKLLEHAQAMVWQAPYVPNDPQLIAKWKREIVTEAAVNNFPHLKELVAAGFPKTAWSTPGYFLHKSAEARKDYSLYVAESIAFFGQDAAYLSEPEWNAFCLQQGEFHAGLSLADPYEIASSRMQWHMDWQDSPKRYSFTDFFKTKCREARIMFA